MTLKEQIRHLRTDALSIAAKADSILTQLEQPAKAAPAFRKRLKPSRKDNYRALVKNQTSKTHDTH